MQCVVCGEMFEFSEKEKELFGKFDVPVSDMCFLCRHKNRLCFRNDRSLYKRTCDATGDTIVSIYHENVPFPVYKPDYWYSDSWDPLSYGREFDFSRPFFDQFHELQIAVPRLGVLNVQGENSDYCNTCFHNKDSYLVFGGDLNQEVLYGTLCMRNRVCVDVDYSNDCELCYETCDALTGYHCQYAFNSKNCSDCYYIEECIGCQDCILCVNLRNKQYCVENKQYSKDDYVRMKNELIEGSLKKRTELFERFLKLREGRGVKFAHIVNCQSCTGDYLKNSKECHACFDVADSEDSYELIFGNMVKDCFDADLLGDNSELVINTISTFGVHNMKNSYFAIDSHDVDYCELTFNSHDLFGCVGMRHLEYCILNKQYSDHVYRDLKAKIVEHMRKTGEYGKFFPAGSSHVAYNESTAHEYFPMSREDALANGYRWYDAPKKKIIPQTYDVPDDISDVSDSVCHEALVCGVCGKNFRILQQELEFYRKQKLPVPAHCENCRHRARMKLRNPRALFDRKCAKCGVAVRSTYSPERMERVYCERCYLNSIY